MCYTYASKYGSNLIFLLINKINRINGCKIDRLSRKNIIVPYVMVIKPIRVLFYETQYGACLILILNENVLLIRCGVS